MGVAFSNTSCRALRWASRLSSFALMRAYSIRTCCRVWRSVSSRVCMADWLMACCHLRERAQNAEFLLHQVS